MKFKVDDSLRNTDQAFGSWLGSTYMLTTDSALGIRRTYHKIKNSQIAKIAEKHPEAMDLFTQGPRKGYANLYYRGRRWHSQEPKGGPDGILDSQVIPLSPRAQDQTSGTFEIFKLVCAEVGGGALEGCSPYGAKISKALIKMAATRIFANPYQCFAELVVNAYDAYHPEAKFGKFGMGFFSVLWWLYKDPKAVMRIRSYVLGESWSLTIRLIDGDLQGELQVLRNSKVTLTGTEIEIESKLIKPGLFSNEMEKLAKLPGVTTTPGPHRHGDIYVTYNNAGTDRYIQIDDFATGIPLRVLRKSLLVPSVSTKTIAGFGGSGARLPTLVSDSEEDPTVMIAVGLIVIAVFYMSEYKFEPCNITIGLAPSTHLPVSRDDFIATPDSIRDLYAQLDIVLDSGVPQVLSVLESFVEYYAAGGAAEENVKAFNTKIGEWRSSNSHRIVPASHYAGAYAYLPTKKYVASLTYDVRQIERDLFSQTIPSPWLNVRFLVIEGIPKPTFAGLNSILFTGSSNIDLIAQSLTDHFLITLIAEPDSLDAELRKRALKPVAGLGLDREVIEAYTHLISVMAVYSKVEVFGPTGTSFRDPLVYFSGWLKDHKLLPAEDLVAILTSFATNFPRSDHSLFEGSMGSQRMMPSPGIYVSSILRASFHRPKGTLLCRPSLRKTLRKGQASEIARDMEEYAVLSTAVEGETVTPDVIKFLAERFRRIPGAKSRNYNFKAFYMGQGSQFAFTDEAKQWIRAFRGGVAEIFAGDTPDLPNPARYTTRQLISSLFVRDPTLGTFSDEMKYYRGVSDFPPTTIQTLDIATNDASTRSPVAATLIEMYQNSMDAGSATFEVKAGARLSSLRGVSPAYGFVVMQVTDDVGMSAENLFHLQIPFLSTKTEGSAAGEMGSGFFNAFRATTLVSISSGKGNATRFHYATPIRGRDGRITDISLETEVMSDPNVNPRKGSAIACFFPCETLEEAVLKMAEIETTSKLLALGPSKMQLTYNSATVTLQGKGRASGKWSPIYEGTFQIRKAVAKFSGRAYTKNVYFGPSTAIHPDLDDVDVNLVSGFEPVHSRNKISMDSTLAKIVAMVGNLTSKKIPMTEYVHLATQSIPGYTSDAAGRYAHNSLGSWKKDKADLYLPIAELLAIIADANGNVYPGNSPEVKEIISATLDAKVGKLSYRRELEGRIVKWFRNKPRDPGLKVSELKETVAVRPEYYRPPVEIESYVREVVRKYYEACSSEPGLSDATSPPVVKYFYNPHECGMAGFATRTEISLGIGLDRLDDLSRAIESLRSDRLGTIRSLIRERSWVWGFLGTGLDPHTRAVSTLVHEMEHYRRAEEESATAHSNKTENLFGVTASRTFDEAAGLVSDWVASKVDLYA